MADNAVLYRGHCKVTMLDINRDRPIDNIDFELGPASSRCNLNVTWQYRRMGGETYPVRDIFLFRFNPGYISLGRSVDSESEIILIFQRSIWSISLQLRLLWPTTHTTLLDSVQTRCSSTLQ